MRKLGIGEVDLVKRLFFGFVVLSTVISLNSIAMASTLTIETWGLGQSVSAGADPYGNGHPADGGWVGTFKVTADGIAGVKDGSFWTFCLELNEDIDEWGDTYNAVVNTKTVAGGVNGGSPDPLSSDTAWLYNEYLLGNQTIDTDAEGKLFQEAIWALEGEIALSYVNGSTGHSNYNQYYQAAIAQTDWTGDYIGNVRVLNLTDTSGNLKQDVLATVPLPGAVWLLGSGLLGLVGIRRRFRKS